MTISKLNLREGKVELVHRFTALSEEVEQTVAPLEPPPKSTLRRSLRLLGKPTFQQPFFRYCGNCCAWQNLCITRNQGAGDKSARMGS